MNKVINIRSSINGEIRGAVKKFLEFFDKDCSVHRESVPSGQSVTVQVLQKKRRDKRQAGSVVSAPSHTSPVVSSRNHRTLRISLPMTFGCSPLSKWASRGHVSQPWETKNGM
jgi:hypothetical protein